MESLALPRPRTSYAVYAGLDSPKDIDYFKFRVEEPMKVDIGILVPHLPEYEDFSPALALAGKGLPPGEKSVPVKFPEECGVIVEDGLAACQRPVFHEPFSNTRYYRGCQYISFEVQTAGDYYIVVWHPSGEQGSYVISFGKAEKWRAKEIPQMIKDIKRIKSGRWIIERTGRKQ